MLVLVVPVDTPSLASGLTEPVGDKVHVLVPTNHSANRLGGPAGDGDGVGTGLGAGAAVPPRRQEANGTQREQLVGAYAQKAWVGLPMHDAYGPHVLVHVATAADVVQYELVAQQPT